MVVTQIDCQIIYTKESCKRWTSRLPDTLLSSSSTAAIEVHPN